MSVMKKALSLLLVAAMALGLVACGNVEKNALQQNQQQVVQTDPTIHADDEVKADDVAAPTTSQEEVTTPTIQEENTPKVENTSSTETVKQPENNKTEETPSQEATTPPQQEPEETQPEQEPQPEVVNPTGAYKQGVVLVKVKKTFNKEDLGTLAYISAEPMHPGSKWYTVLLADPEKTVEAVTYLSGLGTFDAVDYDYIMATTAEVSGNPNYADQTNLGLSNIPYGWTQNGKYPGGSPDVVIAVIDTGVDYNHLDLRNNIWINAGEIPNNGKDDDGNGYIDDVYGWDCVGNDNDPMDDNGHGTHVAGIIAAENNKQGGIGVAYNCKVMVLKAGNSSGYFNNSDIAEAIQYAYMNGASVINMSFGGSYISMAVEEALQSAYYSCVLVAAAGNDSACNNLSCPTCDTKKVSYPAALSYVIGVMSTDANGNSISSFSNYDHYPYDTVEYEVFAVGEGVGSTWPSNKYACLNGTSMAAPTVSGIAALLRSKFTDREVYSTKFIQSQIVNTGTVNPHVILDGEHVTDEAHSVADVAEAMNQLPKPAVNLYDYRIDDSASISSANNGNGVIDAGETVRLYISLHNRGGVASNVQVSIDTYRSEIGDETLTDPYFTFVNPTLQLSDIGTYSVRESGDQYFEIAVSADCPNDYLVDFNIRYTYQNGMDEKDKTTYSGDGEAQFNVSSGWHLPSIISEDTVFTNDRLYIVGADVMIPAGVTVTFQEGCQIQFYDDRNYYNSPAFLVYGELIMNGTQSNMISFAPSEQYATYTCLFRNYGTIEMNYVNGINGVITANPDTTTTSCVCCHLRYEVSSDGTLILIKNGTKTSIYNYIGGTSIEIIDSCYIEQGAYGLHLYGSQITNSVILVAANLHCDIEIKTDGTFQNNFVFSQKKGKNNGYSELIFNGSTVNNTFVSINNLFENLCRVQFSGIGYVANNAFNTTYQQNASQIIDKYYDSTGNPTVDIYGSLADASLLWPYVVSVEMFNAEGEPITTVGNETILVRVTFNRPMNTARNTYLTFGTIDPYADYKIEGDYVSDTVWEGTYTLKAQIENGQNFLQVHNACAAEDPTKTVFGQYQRHEFTIDTTAAMAMTLFATAGDNGIQLTWVQDDYDTLMGYNIYRADSKDGNYVKINPAVLLPGENTFLDDNAEPGKTYWYTFTVVLSDFTESAPAGKVYCTAKDTLNPTIYHTPVNQGYAGNNLVISCVASDNMQIEAVTLYYRTIGSDTWKSLTMSRVNDKFSATVFGSDVTLDGLEYYIEASDGVNTVSKGSAEVPYTVLVKDASSISRTGDVDGNGSVTTKDALMLMQCLNGDLILTDDAFKRADLNGNGELSSSEALRILQYVNGKVPNLDM